MLENVDRYENLKIRLEEERKILEELENNSNSLSIEFNDNKIEINNLIKDNQVLDNKIKQIINQNIFKTTIFLKLFSIIFIVMLTVAVANLSNLNIVIMILSSIFLPLFCIYINQVIIKVLKKTYRKRNKKIMAIETLISKNKEKIEKCKEKSEKLLEDITENTSIYDKQKKKVRLIENLVNEIKIDYDSPIFEEELKCLDNSGTLTRIRKHDKTREIN